MSLKSSGNNPADSRGKTAAQTAPASAHERKRAEIPARVPRNAAEKYNLAEMAAKRKRKKIIIRLSVVFVILLAALIIALNWKSIIAPLRDAALGTGEGGFPVMLPGSASYVMNSLDDNFYLLTDTYLYTFTSEGAQISGVQHGFQNPGVSSGDKRILVYDRNGKGIKLFSRNAEIFSKTLDDSIVFAQMSAGERSAVVTTSSRYSNYLYVFNGEGKQIFRYSSPNDKIMQVCFSDNENYIYVSAVGQSSGELLGKVLCFDITKEQNEIWSASLSSNLPFSLECCKDGVYAVTEKGAFLIDKISGKIKSQNVFSQTVTGIPRSDGARVIFFRDTASNGSAAVTYNSQLAAEETRVFDRLDSFDVSGGVLYVLGGKNLTAYSDKLAEEKVYELDDEYSQVMIIGKYAYLLGYNSVQRIDL